MAKLKFRVETRKIKQPRIVVLRLLPGQGKIIEKSLGSFNSKRSYAHIVKQLSPEELYEFENFIKAIGFAKAHFNCEADALDRFIIKAAPAFKQALVKISAKAKERRIDFAPEYEMLLSVFNKAKAIEQQLAVLTGGEFAALSELGIDITDLAPPKRDAQEGHKLFAAALAHAKSPERLAQLFNDIAAKHQKAGKFKPHHFEYFQGPAEQGNFPKWYYAVAIEALCALNARPEKIIAPALLAEHWLRLNKQANVNATLKKFGGQFPQLKTDLACINAIKDAFIQEELARMCQSPHAPPAPSVAIERWLKDWKKGNPGAGAKTAIPAFNRSFALLANNPFFIEYIERNVPNASKD